VAAAPAEPSPDIDADVDSAVVLQLARLTSAPRCAGATAGVAAEAAAAPVDANDPPDDADPAETGLSMPDDADDGAPGDAPAAGPPAGAGAANDVPPKDVPANAPDPEDEAGSVDGGGAPTGGTGMFDIAASCP
jgi:hypothetical protein